MEDHPASFAERRLTLARYRELSGQKRSETPVLSDDLADFLLHSFPSIPERDATELNRVFSQLLDTLSRELRSTGIYPVKSDNGEPPLEKSEQSLVLRYSSLLTWHSIMVMRAGTPEKAEMIADAAITWAERADDFLQASIAGRVKGVILAEMHDLAGAEKTLRRAIVQARRGGEMAEQATVLADIGMLLILRGKDQEALHAVENGNSLLRHEITGEIAGRIAALLGLVRGAVFESKEDYSHAIATYRKTLAGTNAILHPDLQGEIHYRLSRIYFATGEDRRAVEEGLAASRILEELGEVTELGFVRIGLATTYQRLGDYPNAIDMLEKTEECVSVQGSPLHLEYLIRKGSILTQQGRYDEAENALEDSLRLARETDEPAFIPTTLTLLAEVAMKREDFQLAEEHYDELIESFAHSPAGTLRLQNARAKAILEQGRLDEAGEVLTGLEREAREYPDEHLSLLRNRARISELRGNFREALRCEREAGKIERQLVARKAAGSGSKSSSTADLEAVQLELEAEQGRRRKVERQLVSAMVDVGDQKQAIDDAVDELKAILDQAGNGTVGSEETCDHIRKVLQILNLPDPVESGQSALYQGEDDGFFSRLRRQAPELTSKQERLCGLLRAGMGPKDIERIMNLKAEGLKALRKRVRRALNLRRGQSLEKFIREV